MTELDIATPRCATCPFFVPVKSIHRPNAGDCRRHPLPVAKDTESWCGDHPDLESARLSALGTAIAARLSQLIAGGEPGSPEPEPAPPAATEPEPAPPAAAAPEKKGARHG